MLLAATAARAEDNAIEDVSVDWKSFERNGQLAQVWITIDLSVDSNVAFQLYPYSSKRVRYAIDCSTRMFTVDQLILRDGGHGAGNIVWAARPAGLDLVKPNKGTLPAAIVHAACAIEPSITVAQQVQ